MIEPLHQSFHVCKHGRAASVGRFERIMRMAGSDASAQDSTIRMSMGARKRSRSPTATIHVDAVQSLAQSVNFSSASQRTGG
jgi:hypothetical protein